MSRFSVINSPATYKVTMRKIFKHQAIGNFSIELPIKSGFIHCIHFDVDKPCNIRIKEISRSSIAKQTLDRLAGREERSFVLVDFSAVEATVEASVDSFIFRNLEINKPVRLKCDFFGEAGHMNMVMEYEEIGR